jgi:hypothetical protein
MSIVLATGPSACTDGKTGDKAGDKTAEMTPEQKRAADSLEQVRKRNAPLLNEHDLSSFTKLPAPPAELQEDTIPIRTPEGGPARYGSPSGMLLQKFKGGLTGERRTTWSAYGMNELKVEDFHPIKPIPGVPEEQQNTKKTVIATPEYFYIIDAAKKTAYRENNKEDDTYLLNDSLKKVSFDEFINTRLRTPEPRLPDTVINGYRLRVYQTNTPGFSLTRWVWRGVTMLEHWRGLLGQPGQPTPPDTMEFYAEPVEIQFTPNLPESTFRPPADYKIVEGMPPMPTPRMNPQGPRPNGSMPPPPGMPPQGQPPMPPPGQPQMPPTPSAPPRP